MKMQFFMDKKLKHRCRIIGRNGEIIFSSHQGFSSKQACKDNVNLVARAIRECGGG